MTDVKFPVQKIKLGLAISLAMLGCTRVQAQTIKPVILQRSVLVLNKQLSKPLIFAAPPPPPNIGEPGRRSDAGSRGSCEDMDKQLTQTKEKQFTALVPIYSGSELVMGLTTSEHPTFWFYVPYKPDFAAKFVLRDRDGKSVYQTNVTLPKTPGVVSLSLPSAVAPLEIGKRYHWYFKIYCQRQQPPAFVDGWIQRNELNPTLKSQLEKATERERVAFYAANGIWYEALTASANLGSIDPKNTDWATLLRTVGLDNIVPEPIVTVLQLSK